MPTAPGTYVLRPYAEHGARDRRHDHRRDVHNTSLTVTTTAVNLGGRTATVQRTEPTHRLGCHLSAGGATYIDRKYLNGLQVAPHGRLANAAVLIPMPMTPGTYVLRLYTEPPGGGQSDGDGGEQHHDHAKRHVDGAGRHRDRVGGQRPRQSFGLGRAVSGELVDVRGVISQRVADASRDRTDSAAVPFTMPSVPHLHRAALLGSTGRDKRDDHRRLHRPWRERHDRHGWRHSHGDGRQWAGQPETAGIYASNGSTLLDWKYLNGSQVAPAQDSPTPRWS